MGYKIGVLWGGILDKEDYESLEDITVIQNIGAAQVKSAVGALVRDGAEILVGNPGIEMELRRYSPVPVVIAFVSYIDVLESLRRMEDIYFSKHRKAALVLHTDNPIQLSRLKPFTRFELEYFAYSRDLPLKTLVPHLYEMGYRLVIGGPTTSALATQNRMDSVTLHYSAQALMDGIQKARESMNLLRAEHRQAERLRTVLNVIPDGILVTDEKGNISMCNPQMADFIGMDQERLTGKPVTKVLQDESWREVFAEGQTQANVLVDFQKRQFFSTRKPILEHGDPAGAVGVMQEAHKIQAMERKYRYVQNQGCVAKYRFSNVVGESPAMRETVEKARRYAKFDTTVLIEGETGTGKELFAQSIHNESSRSFGPFVAINCAAIAENLLESELMGYEEGAFTGARKGGKMGLFEQAHNGTIFLDEINQLPISLQSKLLRVLQEKVVTRVGGMSAVPINVRVIAASNENLARLVSAGSFRRDLYYRLNVLSLHLPPLRERREDVIPLIQHFLHRHKNNPFSEQLSPETVAAAVEGYSWPGNVRELQNYLERCSILGVEPPNRNFFPGLAQAAQAPEPAAPLADGDTISLRIAPLREMERQLVRAVVDRCGGNQSQAALLLGCNRNTVHSKLGEAAGGAVTEP